MAKNKQIPANDETNDSAPKRAGRGPGRFRLGILREVTLSDGTKAKGFIPEPGEIIGADAVADRANAMNLGETPWLALPAEATISRAPKRVVRETVTASASY